MWAHAHHEYKARNPLRPGSMGRLRVLEALEVLLCSRAILGF